METGASWALGVVLMAALVWTCCLGRDEKELSEALLPNVSHTFPVDIGAVNRIVQGRISADAKRGTLVPSDVIVEGDTDTDFQVHLRVEVRDSVYKRPHVYDPRIKVNTSDPSNPQFKHPVIHLDDGPLPYGMEFVVLHTDAFTVDEDRFIVVNDFSHLGDETRIHFHVILKDKLAETHYVSNHLPFVVEVEYPKTKPNPNAALFAGVLIITIMAISLIIPFVVRAKRRTKAGKPVCGCGSADDTSDSGSTGSVPDYIKHRSMSIGGKDNLAMILDSGRLMHHRPSIDQHTTIQNHMLRSTSNMKFQPHYLDPHYQDIYDRPDFNAEPPTYANAQPYYNGYVNGNGQTFARGYGINSNRSSASSFYNYPVNFNPATIMNNKRKYVKHSNGKQEAPINGDVYSTVHGGGGGRTGNDERLSGGGLPSKAEALASESPRATLTRGMTIATSHDEIEAMEDQAAVGGGGGGGGGARESSNMDDGAAEARL